MYCDKVIFLNDIKEYQKRKAINPDEQIPDYSALSIMQIANKLAHRPNFIGYSYRDDMVSDAMYTCLKYFDRFDPSHVKNNPFGYFSQICWFAFLQRIAKEKRQSEIRKNILAKSVFETFSIQDIDADEDFKNSFTEFLQDHNISDNSLIHIDPNLKDVESNMKQQDQFIISSLLESEDLDEDTKQMTYSKFDI